MKLDIQNLPDDRSEIETLVNAMDAEEITAAITEARNFILNAKEVTEEQAAVGVLLTRRLRALRETRLRTPTKQRKAAGTVELSDSELFGDL